MADLNSEFKFLAAAARRSVDLLRTHLQGATIRDAERGSGLSSHIENTLVGIDTKLGEAVQSFDGATDTEKIEYIKQVRLLNPYARYMHKAVPWISAAAHPPLTLGALYFIDELGERICGDKPDAITNPDAEFSTVWGPFDIISSRLGLSTPGGATPIVLNFPELETSSHLLLPLYGHELGHTAVDANGLVQKVLDAHTGDDEFDAAFVKTRDTVAASTGQTPRAASIALGERLDWWITELLCDQLAVQALGPSFLYAFCSFLLGEAWNESGKRHPPTCVRVSHLVGYLDESGWSPAIHGRTPTIHKWLANDVAATPPKAGDAIDSFLLYAIGRMQNAIRTETAAYLGPKVYDTAGFDSEIAAIEDLTGCNTLPAQSPGGDPVNRRTIILAAWLSILESADHPQTLASATEDIRSQAFFAKAIEMSALLEAWKANP